MKFALFLLLGVCAFAANGSQNLFTSNEFQLATDKEILETIQEFIEKLEKRVDEAVKELIYATTDTADKFNDDIRKFYVPVYDKITKIIINVKEKCVQLSEQGEHFKECVHLYYPELDQVSKKLNEDITKCMNGDHIQHIFDGILVQLDAINEQIEQVSNVAHECFEPSKPVPSVYCAIEKGVEFAKSIGDNFNNAYEILKVVRVEAAKIIGGANECTQNAVHEAQQKLDTILNDINKYIEFQQTNSSL